MPVSRCNKCIICITLLRCYTLLQGVTPQQIFLNMRYLYQRNSIDDEAPRLAKHGKVICPQCGKKSFVNYIYPDGTAVADGECGKCDRANNCGYHYPPREYFRDNRPLSDNYKRPQRSQRPQPQHLIKPSEPSRIEFGIVERTLRGYDRNPLAIYLHFLFDNLIGAEAVDECLRLYGVGSTKDGKVCYWQIDEYGNVRSGKVMAYDPTTGKRVHGTGCDALWAHSLMKLNDFKLSQAYFGSHLSKIIKDKLIPRNEQARAMGIADYEPPIWLFESEKGALIAALYLLWGGASTTFIPMATGGCGGFNPKSEDLSDPYNKIQVVKNRKVALFPDNGEFAKWKERGERLKGFCKEIYISTLVEPEICPVNVDCEIAKGDGADDVLLRYITAGRIEEIINLPLYGWHGEWKIV